MSRIYLNEYRYTAAFMNLPRNTGSQARNSYRMDATEIRASAATKATTFKDAFRSGEAFRRFIQTEESAIDEHGQVDSNKRWSNEDLDPTPPEKRTCKLNWNQRCWNITDFMQGDGGIS
jgi:hypothetical protein